jgi:hypothetical protein
MALPVIEHEVKFIMSLNRQRTFGNGG